jgi:hypothetical protein
MGHFGAGWPSHFGKIFKRLTLLLPMDLVLLYYRLSTSSLFPYDTCHRILANVNELRVTDMSWSWGLLRKSLVAVGGWILLWNLSPNVAVGLGVIIGLCLVAYWHENPKAQSANRDFTLDFRRRVALVEADTRRTLGTSGNQKNHRAPSEEEQLHVPVGFKLDPISLLAKPGDVRGKFSLEALVLASVILAGGANVLLHTRLLTCVVMVSLLTATFSVARRAGLLASLVASGLGGLMLSLLFFPPVGSIQIARAEDQVSMTLFMLISIAGLPLVSGRKIERISVSRAGNFLNF